MMTKRLANLALSRGSKQRLRNYQSQLAVDRDERNFDYRVRDEILRFVKPTWKQETIKTIRYLDTLRSTKDGKLFSQGVKSYAKIEEAAERFAEPNHPWFGWNRNYKAAKSKLIEEFSKLHLHPLTLQNDDDVRINLPKLDTHAGFLFIETGNREKGENLEGIVDKVSKELASAKLSGRLEIPHLVAYRTQGKGHAFDKEGNFTNDCDHKTRMVTMEDLRHVVAELPFSKPIQDYLATVDWYAGGKDLDGGVSSIISDMRHKYFYWISIDYSAYDQSISAWLIRDAFDIIRTAFDMDDDQSEAYDIVVQSFIEKDFILADRVIHSQKGVPSGSMFTQIIDSIVNRLMILTYAISTRGDCKMIIMGDDNLIYSDTKIDAEHLSSYIRKNFGIEVSADKSDYGDRYSNPTFLSSEWKPEGRYREPHELIAKLLYPERKRVYEGGRTKPEEVLWSYHLAYPAAMDSLIDVPSLTREYPRLERLNVDTIGSHYIPGFLRFLRDYT